jgi:hypothetical protein
MNNFMGVHANRNLSGVLCSDWSGPAQFTAKNNDGYLTTNNPKAWKLGDHDILGELRKCGIPVTLFETVLADIELRHAANRETPQATVGDAKCTAKHVHPAQTDRVEILWAVLCKVSNQKAITWAHCDTLESIVLRCSQCYNEAVSAHSTFVTSHPAQKGSKSYCFTPATGAVLVGCKVLAGVHIDNKAFKGWLQKHQVRFGNHFYAQCMEAGVAPPTLLNGDPDNASEQQRFMPAFTRADMK